MENLQSAIHELLEQLYGPKANNTLDSLLEILVEHRNRHVVHQDGLWTGGRTTTEKDVIMISYADHFRSATLPPIRSLQKWCSDHVKGLVSAIHILPFHPSTSYDGYAITDYLAVDPKLGTWDDIAHFSASGFELMSDLVLNHCSQSHPWFIQFLRGEKPGCDYFIDRYSKDEQWLSNVKRARNLPLISDYDSQRADRKQICAWTTYHRDLVDLDWSNPHVFLEFIRILLDPITKGFRFVRLDAFAYVWKRAQTSCVNLPETKLLLKLFRLCLDAAGAHHVLILPSLTNVTQFENMESLTNGASLVYHLPLSALLLHSLYSSCSQVLSTWINNLPHTPQGSHLLNLAASHDGVGLTWCAGILSAEQLQFLCDSARARGGIVQTRRPTAKSTESETVPWEINITYFSACAPDAQIYSLPIAERIKIHVNRFFTTQSAVVALKGVPALYFSLFAAGENDVAGVNAIRSAPLDPDAHCIERAINRGRFDAEIWTERMKDPTNRPESIVLLRFQRLLRARISHSAFHPDIPQRTVFLASFPSLFVLKRIPVDNPSHGIVCITNFSASNLFLDSITALGVLEDIVRYSGGLCRDVLDEEGPFSMDLSSSALVDARRGIRVPGYGTVWLTALTTDPSPAEIRRFANESLVNASSEARSSLHSDQPALSLGLNLNAPLIHCKSYSLSSERGKSLIASGRSDIRVVHFVRHAESLHKKLQSLASDETGGRERCFCFDSTLGSHRALAFDLLEQECKERTGEPRRCPFVNEAGYDSPLTPHGLKIAHRLPSEHKFLCGLPVVFAATATRTLQTGAVLSPKRLVASEFLRPMIGPHTHSRRFSREILSKLFPSADLSAVPFDEDLALPAKCFESRRSQDARSSAALKEILSAKNANGSIVSEVAVITHFTTLYTMLVRGDDERIFGGRKYTNDMRPLLDCSDCPVLRRLVDEPEVSDAAVLSIVIDLADSSSETCAIPRKVLSDNSALSLDGICAQILNRILPNLSPSLFTVQQIPSEADETNAPCFSSLWRMCLASAAANPHAIAIFGPLLSRRDEESDQISYGELLLKSLRIVAKLKSIGVASDSAPPVGVCVGRGSLSVISAFAVLLASCTYFAIHPSDNEGRRYSVLQQTAPSAVLVTAETSHLFASASQQLRIPLVDVSAIISENNEFTADSLGKLLIPPRSLSSSIYYTFTSGTTGPPKAIVLSHRALLQFVVSMRHFELNDRYSSRSSAFGSQTRILQLSRCSFDISYAELIGALCFGGATVVLPDSIDENLDMGIVSKSIEIYRANWCFMVPAVARLLLDHINLTARNNSLLKNPNPLRSLRRLYLGGEVVPISLAREFYHFMKCNSEAKQFEFQLVNGYGPSECTIFSTLRSYREEEDENLHSLPLGAAMHGYQAYVVDEEKEEQVKPGEVGTLMIAGNALLSEYLRSPVLTADSIRSIRTLSGKRIARVYCTGDLARVDSKSKELYFLGRKDRQVKIHGQRLELSAVEAEISANEHVQSCAVKKFAYSFPHDRQILVAYISWKQSSLEVASPDQLISRMRELLSRKSHLLFYMIPSVVVSIATDLPRTTHGKINYHALEAPSFETLKTRDLLATRICVIGSGVAGILTAIDCQNRGLRNIVVLERESELGGVWSSTGSASEHSRLQQPSEYYELDFASEKLPSRFPSAPTIRRYLNSVAERHSLLSSGVISLDSQVIKVKEIQRGDERQLKVYWKQKKSDQIVSETFDFVICATGRFDATRPVIPKWISTSGLSSSAQQQIVPAMRLNPQMCKNRNVVIVGGGPYAIEAIRLCCQSVDDVKCVSVVMRRSHWVFPRKWFQSRALTRLFWKLCSGVGLSKKMILLSKISIALHYHRAGILHLLPRCNFTDPKTSISDEFFEYAKRSNYVLGEVISANNEDENSLLITTHGDYSTRTLPADLVVIACGFERPRYPFLSREAASSEMYLGCFSVANPRLCFVGVGLGEGVFPNPHTMRSQIDLILNHIQYWPKLRKSEEEMRRWISLQPKIDGECRGSACHLSEHLAELQFQRKKLLSSNQKKLYEKNASSTSSPSVGMEEMVLEAARSSGLSLDSHGSWNSSRNLPLVTLGMDSIAAVRFRTILAHSLPNLDVPTVASLLWDLPTLDAVVSFFTARAQNRSEGNGTTSLCCPPVSSTNNDVEPLMTAPEAHDYVLSHLLLSEDVFSLRLRDPVEFVTRVCERFQCTVPFQSFTILHTQKGKRQFPSLQQVKKDVLARIGGCCYVMNVFMRELLRAFEFDTYFARCAIHNVEDCHMTIMVRNLDRTSSKSATTFEKDSLWLVDVGCGYLTPRPICISSFEKESEVYKYGFLRMKFIRAELDEKTQLPLYYRLHASDSTFEARELTLSRLDGFDHLFWKMSTRERPLHDIGETEQVRAYTGYQKLRAAIAIPSLSSSSAGERCRMIYFKADNHRGELVASVQEDVDGTLCGTTFKSESDLIESLCKYFSPAFSRESITAAVNAVKLSH